MGATSGTTAGTGTRLLAAARACCVTARRTTFGRKAGSWISKARPSRDWTSNRTHRNLVDNDYRFGVPLTARQGPFETKFGYYHLCAHIGDEYLLETPRL